MLPYSKIFYSLTLKNYNTFKQIQILYKYDQTHKKIYKNVAVAARQGGSQ